MRVGIVSAHYPPNFVSGGTLVPQRMAAGLVRRGHDVAVFAGRLDPDQEPLHTHTDSDDAGFPVTWVNTTPWSAWDDVHNYDNPPIGPIFAEWLATTAPDVVHFHSLQTLGAELVSIARAHGCATVVTMHDFWWVCSRQFLVDTAYRPCSLVVDAGICACQSGRDALDQRAAILAPHLRAADRILAPSTITAEVLIANGVDPDRLVVNENGMDRAAGTVSDPAVPTEVRFRYAGGPDPMKGANVLVEAVEAIDPTAAWSLVVHTGADDRGALDRLADHASVTLAAPYSPDDLDQILADTDVLVLPSVMRETHSILTREALLRGVAVIASASLGPEQVIESGRNGRIVPSNDPRTLAAAMTDYIDDRPSLVAAKIAATSVTVRSVADQVEELEAILHDVVSVQPDTERPDTERPDTGRPDTGRPDTGRPDPWVPRHVVYVVGIDGAPLRYRAQFPAEALGLAGVQTTVVHYSDPGVAATIAEADAVIVYRVPATPRILAILDAVGRTTVPVVFDVDDLIVDPSVADEIPALRLLAPDEARLWLEGVQRYRTTLEHCDAYVGSTEPLVERVAHVTGLPAHHKANGYGLDVARHSDRALRRPRTPGPLRIGYFSGTKTHDEDLHHVVPALVTVLTERPDVELWLGGLLPPVEALDLFGDRVRRLDFRPWTELPDVLRDLDINLAPLADLDTFNQAKSAIKWLEAALVETPTIATATRPFKAAIRDGVTGILITDPAEWSSALTTLIDDDAARSAMGAAARREALIAWSPHRQGRRMLDILADVRSRPRAIRPTTWTDVTVDEPAAPGPVALTAYPASDSPTPAAPMVLTPIDPGLLAKLRWSMANETWPVIAARTVRTIGTAARRVAGRARREARARLR